MPITIKIEGIEALRREFSNLDAKFDQAVSDAIEDTVFAIQLEVTKRINRGPATGRVYTHEYWTDSQGRLRQGRERRKPHQASAPGEAPMADKGGLVASIYMDISPIRATVGSRLAYSAMLEFGTRKIRPRPVWVPVAEREKAALRERIMENLRQASV